MNQYDGMTNIYVGTREHTESVLCNICRSPHPLFTVPGFETSQIRWCTMHCVNLGVLQNLNGSLVSLLFEHRNLVNHYYNDPVFHLIFFGGRAVGGKYL